MIKIKSVLRWWPLVTFILLNGCMPREVYDWNRNHPPCDADNCGKQTSNLAPHPVVGWHEYGEADRVFFQFLHSMVPGDEANKITILSHPHNWKERSNAVSNLVGGGFLLIRGDYGDLSDYFRGRGWQRLPFYWRKHQIWRKPPFYWSSQRVQSAG